MFRSLVVIAAVTLSAYSEASAESFVLTARTGLPRTSLIGGVPISWRYSSVRVETRIFEAEFRSAECAIAAGSVRSAGDEGGGCQGSDRVLPPELRSQGMRATIKLPELTRAGPLFDITFRQWRSAVRSADFDTLQGSAAEIQATQRAGPFSIIAGYALPLGAIARREIGPGIFGGVSWQTRDNADVELFVEATGSENTPRTRELTARYGYFVSPGIRFVLYATRAAGDTLDRWKAGLGLEQSF